MSTPASNTGDHQVVLTGILSDLQSRHDGGLSASLAHGDGTAWVVFPYEVHLQHASVITAGAHVTVRGANSGPAVRVLTVEAAGR